MNLYEVIYRDRNGNLFSKIVFANTDESAWARAKLGKKSSVIISLQKVPIEHREGAE